MNVNNKRPARSPLVGRLVSGRRRYASPLRKVRSCRPLQFIDITNELDSDDDSSCCWDKESIASEIMTCSDFEGVFADNSDI